jgi:hypothetical protein
MSLNKSIPPEWLWVGRRMRSCIVVLLVGNTLRKDYRRLLAGRRMGNIRRLVGNKLAVAAVAVAEAAGTGVAEAVELDMELDDLAASKDQVSPDPAALVVGRGPWCIYDDMMYGIESTVYKELIPTFDGQAHDHVT